MKHCHMFQYNVMYYYCQLRHCNYFKFKLQENSVHKPIYKNPELHCYKSLFPWKNISEFSDFIVSSVVYNKNGLIAVNKPFGIKIHGHEKPGTRSKDGQRYIIPTIQDCSYTFEDALPALKKHLNVSNLNILKSAERYTSGLVLLGTSEDVSSKVRRSCAMAKCQKIPYLCHWFVTLGFPVVPSRKERVCIKLTQLGHIKEPIIETSFSKRSCKNKTVHPVIVDYKVLSINKTVPSSLVEISTSSVKWHFVRVYASNRIATIMGDIMYASRMDVLLGVPVKVHIENAVAFQSKSLPKKLAEALNLPAGSTNHSLPTLLHLRSMMLPSFYGEDVILIAEPPKHFQWTLEKLRLTSH